ncbi:MAG: potassium transporter TrkA [Nitrospirae bacterium CG_4_9_14_3_um_filter_53_35]|nr:MAG: potassium transporter TrkA [Nitrospirae bacterium CG2_30_53_67]PIS35974.1 MAG: potassium transporter TrkA [Nitrospirae bacterium CG08_land_8_20_14_0_20_52_24]PIV85170.1 MAG: potassium transporter TrkA [Nitrospirae bacterium CG17_big_fil_post_rev_8_21_14_2_50_50_9]PIW86200.1 MAG: potassium transporter TrkA [Nitrospirae bacterium CG_4_8_14_3_um_filter_50_41]PIX84926.1 MAG: potassium transporter TrkA [Nitrospirae bacterium CG_4_10_14_3_um_filter_53_41]PJA76144.1 MAG: potassium transporter
MKQQFVIIGLGMFGSNVAKTLYDAGMEVIVLDRDKELVQRAKEFASRAMVADVTNKEVLQSLGLDDKDVAVIAMGESLEASILATLYLKEMGIKNIIAKANEEDHGKILSQLGAAEVIFPEKDVAIRLAQRISAKNIIDYIPFVEGYSIQEVAPSNKIVGHKIRDLELRKKFGVQIIAIKDMIEDKVELVIDPDKVIKDSDLMILIGKNSDLERVQSL